MSNYFIYVGNAYPHKNLTRLIEAASSLKVNLKLVCGKTVFTKRLVEIIRRKNAEKYVEILGFQSDNNLKNLYEKSIAFVFPTLSEGFGLPPMEAINAGTLAVVSDIPVLREIYGDCVYYFNPKDTKSIVSELKKVASIDKKTREARIASSQKYLKRYSFLKMAEETLKVYNSV